MLSFTIYDINQADLTMHVATIIMFYSLPKDGIDFDW
jgi:hypothetical protein